MNNIKTLFDFFNSSIKTLFIFDKVTVLIIYERFLVGLLLLFGLLSFILQGPVDFIIFQKIFLIIIGLHSYQGLSVIFDDYLKNIFMNHLMKSCFFILWLVFICI